MKKITISALALLLSASVFAQDSATTKTATEHTSVSVKNSDHDYAVVASFNPGKAERLKSLITKNIGNPNDTRGDIYFWSLKNSYTITLSGGKLMINMNKDNTTAAMVKIFERLGSAIQPTLEFKK